MDIYQLNEQHHRVRAEYWLNNDRPDYAQGSLRKAAKWQARRREFEYMLTGPYPKTEMGSFMDEYLRLCEKKCAEAFVMALYGDDDRRVEKGPLT